MVALAGSDRVAGELTVTGSEINGESPAVTVNGEVAKTGRSIFSSNVIATPSNAGAVINLGKSGIIELSPNTIFTVSFDGKSVSGDLASGKISVLGTANGVNVKTAVGQMVKLNAGESVTASGKPQDDDDHHGGAAWWIWAVIFGGAAAAILIATFGADNRVALGGGASTVSPTR